MFKSMAIVATLGMLAGCGGMEMDDDPLPTTPVGVDFPDTPDFKWVQKDPPMAVPAITALKPPTKKLRDPRDPDAPKSQYLNIPKGGGMVVNGDAALNHLMATDFTLELWVRFETMDNQEVLSANGLLIGLRSGYLRAQIAGNDLLGLKATAHEWYHLTLVVDGNEVRFYSNGNVDAILKINRPWKRPSGALTFGTRLAVDKTPFWGVVDNFHLTQGTVREASFVVPQDVFLNDHSIIGFNFDDISGRKITNMASTLYKGRLVGHAAIVPGAI